MEKKQTWMHRIIWNKTALGIAVLHFAVSFLTDDFIFRYVKWDFSTGLQAMKSLETIAVKIVFLGLLVLLWQGLFYFFCRAKKEFRNLALFYFGIMVVLLLLTWPGIWRMDEFGLLSSSVQLYPHWWQNYITSVWYIFSLMLFPFPAGVILVQIIAISLIYARIVSNGLREYDRKTKMKIMSENEQVDKKSAQATKNAGYIANGEKGGRDIRRICYVVVLTIPFVMFPVLDSNLYPLRMSFYAFLELMLLSELYFLYRRRTAVQSESEIECDDRKVIFALVPLAAVVTVWRTEAIYYLVLFPVILLCLGGLKRYLHQILLYFIAFVILFAPQKIGEKMTSGDQYELTSVVLPLVPLVLQAQEDGADDLLAEINLVVDTDVISRAAAEGKNGINMFWSEPDFQRSYTSEDFARFQSAYRKLIIRYPMIFLQERWQTFLASTDLLENTTELFTNDEVENYVNFRKYLLNRPISDKMRTAVIKTLEIRKSSNYEEKYPVTDWVYSPLPSILILLIACVIALAKKKRIPLVILFAAFARVPLVFLTAPSRLFMYYYSVYLIGYVLLFYLLAGQLSKKGNYSDPHSQNRCKQLPFCSCMASRHIDL